MTERTLSLGKIYYVGTEQEVAHHARPLQQHLDISIVGPDQIVEQAVAGDLAIFTLSILTGFAMLCRN